MLRDEPRLHILSGHAIQSKDVRRMVAGRYSVRDAYGVDALRRQRRQEHAGGADASAPTVSSPEQLPSVAGRHQARHVSNPIANG